MEHPRRTDYQIHEFAKITGLTVRALQHYDHLGLLRPLRSRAGHRTYSDQDLQVLVQILALKSVGLPLKQIATLRKEGGPGLARALTMQRVALEKRKPLLDRAITAIQNVELSLEQGRDADPQALRHLIEAVAPPDAGPTRATERSARRPTRAPLPPVPDRTQLRQQWAELLAEVEAASEGDPSSAESQAFARRWIELLQQFTGSANGIEAQLMRSAELLGSQPRGDARFVSDAHERAWSYIGKALAVRAAGGPPAARHSDVVAPRVEGAAELRS
jgi:DNA-binding transcriptional MerR regulator